MATLRIRKNSWSKTHLLPRRLAGVARKYSEPSIFQMTRLGDQSTEKTWNALPTGWPMLRVPPTAFPPE